VADVEVEVEVGILDPVGVVEAERHLAETAPQRLEEMEPALDLRPPGGERVVVGVVLGFGVDREAAARRCERRSPAPPITGRVPATAAAVGGAASG
jgi:hypothetical protein